MLLLLSIQHNEGSKHFLIDMQNKEVFSNHTINFALKATV